MELGQKPNENGKFTIWCGPGIGLSLGLVWGVRGRKAETQNMLFGGVHGIRYYVVLCSLFRGYSPGGATGARASHGLEMTRFGDENSRRGVEVWRFSAACAYCAGVQILIIIITIIIIIIKLPSMLGSPQTTISSRLQWSLLALPMSQLLTSSRRSEIK